MEETYKLTRPAILYDVAALETWLEDRARAGDRLVRFSGWSGVFTAAEPCQCRYRLQPLLRKEEAPDPEQAEVCAALGWNYATTLKHDFHLWRCDDPNAPELDTDPVVQGEGYRRLKRRILRDTVLCVLVSVVCSVLLMDLGLLYILETYVPGEFIARLVSAVLLDVMIYWDCRAMFRLVRTLRTGIPLKRPAPYRAQLWMARVCLAALVFVCLTPVIGMKNMGGSSLSEGWYLRDDVSAAEVITVDLAALDELPVETEYWASPRKKCLELAPEICYARQYMDGNHFLNTDAYRLVSRLLAPVLVRDLLEDCRRFSGAEEMERLEAAGLDQFWWGRDEIGDQMAVVARGELVMSLRYRGPGDLREQAAVIAAALS